MWGKAIGKSVKVVREFQGGIKIRQNFSFFQILNALLFSLLESIFFFYFVFSSLADASDVLDIRSICARIYDGFSVKKIGISSISQRYEHGKILSSSN